MAAIAKAKDADEITDDDINDLKLMLLERMKGPDLDALLARIRGGTFMDEVYDEGLEKVRESFNLERLVALTAR